MKESEWKNLLGKSIKIILCIIVVFLVPIILPLIVRLFISFNFFSGIDEFRSYMEVFYNKYFLGLVAIVFGIIVVCVANKDKIERFLQNSEFSLKHKDTVLTKKGTELIEETTKRKDFVDELSREDENDYNKEIATQMKEELGIVKKNQTSESEKKENDSLREENNNLRNYAAYNIINKKTKELLHCIYCENYIELSRFKDVLINSYKNRNKNNSNISRKNLNKYALNKYETILKGLEYLNILEVADDNQSLVLTEQGKVFVKKYIEKEVDEDE